MTVKVEDYEKLPVYYSLNRCLHMMSDGHIGIINKSVSVADVTFVGLCFA